MKKSIFISFAFVLMMVMFSFAFTGCWSCSQQDETIHKLISTTDFSKISSMRITEVESGDNYHITEMDQMQEIFNRYSDVTVIEKKRSTEGLLEQIYNKGERIYAFTIYYLENELDPYSTDSYEISVNVEYASSISETIVAYYLQRREGIYVYYTETTVDEYNYFANIFETYEDAQ